MVVSNVEAFTVKHLVGSNKIEDLLLDIGPWLEYFYKMKEQEATSGC